nr:hypothetical protein [Pyropia sp. Myanmar_A]BED43272.1 hypothetical protein [Pyropia sp. Myanmar_B]BED43469.1 hypothetical protein [Pyropia sp. Myanmar_C]
MYITTNKILLLPQKSYLEKIDKFDYLSEDLHLDKISYFTITISRNNKHILLEQFCYNNSGHLYSILYKGRTAKYLCFIIFQIKQLKMIVSITHALYLGRELMKAELALLLDQQYIQD